VLRGLRPALAILLGVLLAACSSTVQPGETPTLAPGQTAQPTATPAEAASSTPLPSRDTFAPLATPGPPGGSPDPAAFLTAQLSIVNVSDANVLAAVFLFDPAQGQFQFAGAVGVGPGDYDSQAVGASTYQVQLFNSTTTDLNATSPKPSLVATVGQCTFEVAAGDRFVFAVAPDGAIITRNGEPPAAGASMTLADSPLCHAATPTAAPSSTP
jgi:hypothetical protein